MVKNLVGAGLGVAGLAAAAVLVIGGSHPLPPPPRSAAAASPAVPPHKPAQRRPLVEKDSRRRSPGIHRAGPAELAVQNRVALAESQKIQALSQQRRFHPDLASVPATAWVNLGPTNALNEFNGVDIPGVDSGRPSTVLVDPRNPDVVYMAGSGGGLWKSFNFTSAAGPSWSPVSDALPSLAIGALALDDTNPDTLYVGNGDFVDSSGNTVMKSTDGGSTWGTPVILTGRYPSPNGATANVSSVRTLVAHGPQVLVGTDVGLFASSNGGATFSLVDLPNTGGQVLIDSLWSVVATGGGHYVASGVTACDAQSPQAPLSGGVDPGAGCTAGNNGEIWHSNDGVTWALSVLPQNIGTGRITLAAGATTNPTSTAVYAFVGQTDGFKTLGFWRSSDGGITWVDATGALANPTLLVNGSADCASIDLGQDQTWYNQAIVVDPTNPDHVLAGGSLCGARTLNASSASPRWELISHWLPNYDGGKTANGRLPYVHADWHAALSIVTGGTLRTFAGTDGGVFSSTNLFDPATQAELVTWSNHNRGLISHLVYAIGTGDPVTANPFVLFAGLQDNGTRFRTSPATPSVFNQPVGGDGIGATVHVASSGTTYWGSVEFAHVFCQPSPTVDCSDGNNWGGVDPTLNPGERDDDDDDGPRHIVAADGAEEDAEPFFIHYANVETDTVGQSVLTHSNGQVFVSSAAANGDLSWAAISQDLTGSTDGAGFTNVTASRTTPGLYGAAGAVSAEPFYVTTQGNTMATWTAARPVFPIGTTARLTGPASIDFPPVQPAGTVPGQVFIGSFTNTMNDAARTPPPDDKGHLWRTTDFGQTWTSIVGTDAAHRLPNVAVFVAKYDPITPTTMYAGTALGIYVTTNDGASWDRMGEGFPVVPVRDIYVARNQDFIRVATYGRGLWEIYPSAAANQGAPGNGDYDRNLRIDWIDLAAMSSRLGDTPANTTQPFYSWIMDMTAPDIAAPLQQIDDDDLTALLAIFGSHP